VATPYGISLYHCHSTILELVVEFGAAGLVWLAWTVAALWRLVWRSKEAGWRSYSLALAVSTFAFFFDLFLFKETRVNAIWWIFALSAFALQPKDQRKAGGFR
jgi:O-antigen ligase